MYINVKKKFKHGGEKLEYCDTKKEEKNEKEKKCNKSSLCWGSCDNVLLWMWAG